MWWSDPVRRRSILVACALLLTGGCGLRPLYAGGAAGPAYEALQNVEVAAIADRSGQLVGDELRGHMRGGAGATHRLEVAMQESTVGFSLRGDESITRERVSLDARYQLINLKTGKVAFEGTARSDGGVDVVRSNEFSVVSAEQSATVRNARQVARQILDRLAVYFSSGK